MEEWRDISYAPNYKISNFANIKNIKTNKLLNINYERLKKTKTRARAGLSHNGKSKGYYLHRIVAEHFIDNPDKLPEVNHKDGNFYNNHASNLEWISKHDNMKHARDNNLINNYKRKVIIKNKITNETKIFDSVTECASYFNCSIGQITLLCGNKSKSPSTKKQIIQYNKNNEIINKFNSIRDAKDKLKINNISTCCYYYEYNDLTRPKSYTNKTAGGFIFKFGEEIIDKINKFEICYLNNDENIKKIQDSDMIWKSYPECDKYLVSNTGEIKNKKTERIMMGSKVNGYRFVNLHINSSTPKMNRLIHRMVAQTFLENPENKPVVNHKDTDILNNNVNNLEWVTYKENLNTLETKNNLKKGKNSKQILQIKIDSGEIINKFYGAAEGEEKVNIYSNVILNICHFYNNKNSSRSPQKTYQKTYIFIFEEDKDNINNYLKIATTDRNVSKKVYQYYKHNNKFIQTFNSAYDAAKTLNISNSGVSNCCCYYKYTDANRPKSYNLKSFKGFIFKYDN